MEREGMGNQSLIWSLFLPMSAWQGIMKPERWFYFEGKKMQKKLPIFPKGSIFFLYYDKAML